MKKALVAVVFVSLFALGLGQASAYTNALGWSDSDPYFTHQTWSFGSNATTVNADAGFINTTGTPSLTIDPTKATWAASGAGYGFVNGSGTPYTGIWNATGAQTEALLATFTIPVTPEPYASKVWVDAILQTTDPNFGADLRLTATTNGVTHVATSSVVTPINVAMGVYRVGNLWENFSGMTTPVTVTMTSNLPASTLVNFDYVTIDTIPEPGSIAMLIAGALALLGWAGLRRR